MVVIVIVAITNDSKHADHGLVDRSLGDATVGEIDLVSMRHAQRLGLGPETIERMAGRLKS